MMFALALIICVAIAAVIATDEENPAVGIVTGVLLSVPVWFLVIGAVR